MAYQINPFTGKLDITPFSLDGAGKIPSDYLPSYVDDVVEYDDLASFPGTGETGKIYVAKDTGYTYRWTGSVYVRIGSGGEVNLNLGSEGSPSLYFTGDPNTGLYSPGADQVALSTNGVQRINIEADGDINIDSGGVFYDATNNRLAIGTTSPGTKFHVEETETSGTNTAIQRITTASGGSFNIRCSDLASAAPDWEILTGNSEEIIFSPSSSEAARLDGSGRLLVGTSSNSGGALLQVNGDRIRVATAKTPASASDTGTAGEICWDASYVYVCTATNTWKRAALSTW